jgi:hypothetical protein
MRTRETLKRFSGTAGVPPAMRAKLEQICSITISGQGGSASPSQAIQLEWTRTCSSSALIAGGTPAVPENRLSGYRDCIKELE